MKERVRLIVTEFEIEVGCRADHILRRQSIEILSTVDNDAILFLALAARRFIRISVRG